MVSLVVTVPNAFFAFVPRPRLNLAAFAVQVSGLANSLLAVFTQFKSLETPPK
jgi:hypothetical protein